MGNFEFYDINKLLEQGVNEEQLREIVAEANRFRVAQHGRLNEAFQAHGLPLLTPNRPSEWNGEIDRFIDAHFEFEGVFQAGESVIHHNAPPLADAWHKQLIGLDAKILRGWSEKNRNLYEIEIAWNKHKCVCSEQSLLKHGNYEAPWWCSEVLKQRSGQLYVKLTPFNNATLLLNELTLFVKNMANYGSRKLNLYTQSHEYSDFRPDFSIEYDSRLSFYVEGKRSNRKAVIASLANNF